MRGRRISSLTPVLLALPIAAAACGGGGSTAGDGASSDAQLDARGENGVDVGDARSDGPSDRGPDSGDAPSEAGPADGPRPVDECTAAKPDWIFCDGFEKGGTAPFWDGPDTRPVIVAEPGPAGLAGNHVVQLRVPAGRGGAGLRKNLAKTDKLYARWYVRWEPGHDFAAPHHGPGGLVADAADYLGRSGIRPTGDDYISSTMESIASAPYTLQAYTYYRGMYMDCADPAGSCWGDMFPCTAGPGYCKNPDHKPKVTQPGPTTGKWYCLEQMIDTGTPTTDAKTADGALDFWLDGLEVGPWTGLWMRTVPSLQLNKLWLYLFHHDDTHSVEGIQIDNVVVSKSRVGCL